MKHKLLNYCVLAIIPVMASNLAQGKLLQILHTNDTHAYLDGGTHDKDRGGSARLKSLMDYYREKMKSEGVETLTLDAGDFTEGNAYYMADRARKSFEVHDQMGYDAIALGNHDYLMGVNEMERILGDVSLTSNLLCANCSVNHPARFKNLNEHIKPFYEKEIYGLKFGILGLTTDEIFYTWRFDGGKITSPIKAMTKYESILKERKNDYIIALTHIGYKTDMKLVHKSKYVDLVVGGHSHTPIYEPLFVDSKLKKQVPIVQAGMHTELLGRIIVNVEKNKPMQLISYELIPTRYEGEDYKVKARVEEADQDLNSLYGKEWLEEKVGVSDLKPEDPEGSKKWAFFITDILRERTGADIAIHTPPMNGEQFPVGILTRRDIINSMPRVFDIHDKYGWNMYTTRIRGAWLRLVFEALAMFGEPLTFSGIEVQYTYLPIGIRIKNITVGGKAINPLKMYTVAFTEGIIKGAEGVSPYTLALLRFPKRFPIKIWEAIEMKLKTSDAFTINKNISHQLVLPIRDQIDPEIKSHLVPRKIYIHK